jgi:hypothetical protein
MEQIMVTITVPPIPSIPNKRNRPKPALNQFTPLTNPRAVIPPRAPPMTVQKSAQGDLANLSHSWVIYYWLCGSFLVIVASAHWHTLSVSVTLCHSSWLGVLSCCVVKFCIPSQGSKRGKSFLATCRSKRGVLSCSVVLYSLATCRSE